jgi:hypothetical protein
MIDAEDPIPPEGILLVEAFEYFYRRSTPNWVDLQNQLNPSEAMGLDEEQQRQLRNRAWGEYDRAQRVVNRRSRRWLTEGSLAAFVRDPRHGQNLKLPCDGWDELGEFENGITSNFVGPDDLFNRGPNTVVEGKRRPVFFIRSEFEKLVETECGEAPEPTKPAEPEPVMSKVSSPLVPTPKRTPQLDLAERYIKKHYPNGTDEVSTTAIHRKLAKDKGLAAEIEKEDARAVPSPATINRLLNRRSK